MNLSQGVARTLAVRRALFPSDVWNGQQVTAAFAAITCLDVFRRTEKSCFA
jgi:hypothetical protein